MTTREEKLAAARKKLRAYMGQTRDSDNSRITGSSNTSSPSPNLAHEATRSESPVDPTRIAWERRQTIDVGDSPVQEYVSQNTEEKKLSRLPQNFEVIDSSAGNSSNIENASQNSALQNPAPALYSDSPTQNSFATVDTQLFLKREAQFQEQLRKQGQAITVLISERNDSQAALSRVQAQLHEKSDAFGDLKYKYLDALQRIRDLEENPPQIGPMVSQISAVEDKTKTQELELAQQKIASLEEQLKECRQKLDGKKMECESLAQDVRQLKNDLSVSDVRIQQLSVNETSVSNIRMEELEVQKNELEGKVALLERRLQAAAVEGEQAGHRFRMYADQCDSQIVRLRGQVKDLLDENVELKTRCNTLNDRIKELEELVIETSRVSLPLDIKVAELKEENTELAKYVAEKEGEVVLLQGTCKENEEKLSILQDKLKELLENKRQLQAQAVAGHADPALLAAMESDKVAASRAVSQNQRLKEQLAEFEAAFVRMSNEKSDLTAKLSHEEHENKELRRQLNSRDDHNHNHGDHCHEHNHDDDDHEHESDSEKDIDSLRHQVNVLRKDKTELITRLQALTADGKTYQAQSHKHHHHHDHATHHHEHASNEHEHENHDVHEHSDECNHDSYHEKPAAVNPEVAELRRVVEQLQEDKAELLRRLGAPSEDPQIQGLLEEKLRRTMDEIAVLDEEKQRLEHLVLQLQGETETIGEYISLYQKQRMLLRKRSLEKDEQLQQLTKDREELREKLAALNDLVDKLVEKESSATSGLQTDVSEKATAERIRSLITEIGNNNVINAQHHGVEHCFCCSGRLQTV